MFSLYRFKALLRYSLLSTVVLFVVTAHASPALSLKQAITTALSSNPSLIAIDARAQALAEIPSQVGALPDPHLSVKLLNLPLDSLALSQEGMTQFQVGLSQTLPYPGKLALRAQTAHHEAAAAKADIKEKRLHLVRDIKTLWWNIFYLERALEVVKRNKVLLAQFVNVAETRYTVGRGLQQDILLAQLELSKLSDKALSIKNSRKNETARLNTLMNRPVAMAIQLPASVNQTLRKLKTLSALQQQARHRPLLMAQAEHVKAAKRRIDLAKKAYAPDFNVGAAYGLRSGNNPNGSRRADFGSLMFSMNLPIYADSKQDRGVDQRRAEWRRQQYRWSEAMNQVASQIQRAMTDYQLADERTQLFQQEIIPQAQQTVEAMMAGYQVGNVDFLNLVRSQTTLYNYETQYWNALSRAKQAVARLVLAVGEENIYE